MKEEQITERNLHRHDPLRLAGFAENIAIKMALIDAFKNPDPPLTEITTAATTLRLKQEATLQGGPPTLDERDDAFDILEGFLRELAAFVEDKAKNDRDLMQSTGFEVTTASHSSADIITPIIYSITNIATSKLQFKVQSCGARAYEL